MNKDDKNTLKTLNSECKNIVKELRAETQKETPDQIIVENLSKELEKRGNMMAELYAKYGFSMDE